MNPLPPPSPPRWLARFRRPDPERLRWEQPLRALVLERLLGLSALAVLAALACGAVGHIPTAIFPWDLLEVLVLQAAAWCFLRRGRTAVAAPLYLCSLVHAAGFACGLHGLLHPAPAFFLPGILISGLVVGGYYLAGFTLLSAATLLWVSWMGRPFEGGAYALWCALMLVTAYGTWLFSLHLERLLEASRRAEEARREAILDERMRLAREIHDTLAQGFAGVVVQINAAEQVLPAECEAWPHLEHARALARRSLDEARRSILALRSGELRRGELLEALLTFARTLGEPHGLVIEGREEGARGLLPEAAEEHLLRIGQEAVTNAIRHAEARTVRLKLAWTPAAVVLAVTDDGHGFDPAARGFGLRGVEERLREIGGTLSLKSGPDGTALAAHVPLSPP